MAKIIVGRDQQAEMRRLHPKPAYSRVVSVQLVVFEEWGDTFVVTPVVGDRVWLLGIRVWCDVKVVNIDRLSFFNIYTGSGNPQNAQDVLAWVNILPSGAQFSGPTYWQLFDGMSGFEWSMMRFFQGSSRRFGIVGSRFGIDYGMLNVSFEISEG